MFKKKELLTKNIIDFIKSNIGTLSSLTKAIK